MSSAPPRPAPVAETDRVRLAPGVVLRHDRTRDQWVLLGPERVLVLDETALEAVRACAAPGPGADGASVGEGIDRLAAAFDAPRDAIAGDVLELLDDLRNRGFLTR
ncbi:pyrroloquinoline quinone biosynthesis peptide chaperone PqqD [Azospirillum halopraeferens]|uniref:pyrroloquinoline quinone biosynthesis peptide chaperone PqqD n=1 Tax=Azospirillum halopraeferens TaxID=34010 RepID=UPI0003FB4D20|nr:pyrroloquinoline quinone biosynthesis peptide chaperone PqqD [Azospirillum halopraeferens]